MHHIDHAGVIRTTERVVRIVETKVWIAVLRALSLSPLLLLSACNGSQFSAYQGKPSTGSSGGAPTTQSFPVQVVGLPAGESFQWNLVYGAAIEATGTISSDTTTSLTGPGVTTSENYTFSVTQQPTGQTCSIQNATGTITGANTPVTVIFTCMQTVQSFSVATTGLITGESFQWSLSYGTTVEATGTITFNDNQFLTGPAVTSPVTYTFSVTTQPAGKPVRSRMPRERSPAPTLQWV